MDGKTEEAEKALAKLFPPEVDEETRKTIEARIDTLTEKKAAEPEEEKKEKMCIRDRPYPAWGCFDF